MVILFLFLVSSSWLLLRSWSSSYVPSCILLAMVMGVFLCSWLPPLAHVHGHPLLFLVAFFVAIVVSSCVLDCVPPSYGHGHPLVFLVALLVAITMVVLSCFWLPLPWHCRSLFFVFLLVLFLAIIMVVFIFLCSWLCSSWPSRGCPCRLVFFIVLLLAIAVVVVVFLCSWLPFLNHHCGHPLVFLVVLI